MTLATLATLMISTSDNTAADALAALLGRPLLEQAAPPRDRPFLTTRELYLLKFSGNSALLARFRAGDEAARRAVLAELAPLPVPPPGSASIASAPDVGWFFSTRELCGLMASVDAVPAMHVNPGPATALGFVRAAFKGGNEPGVISLASLVVNAAGRHYCVAATWNNEGGVDDNRFAELYRTLLAGLR